MADGDERMTSDGTLTFYEQLRTPDERSLRFTPLGLATGHLMRPEASANYLRSLISLPIAPDVDMDVQRTLQRLRSVFHYGLFDYQLFTAAHDLAYLAVEGALRRRLLLAYPDGIPFVCDAVDRRLLKTDGFDAVHEAVRRGGAFAFPKWRLGGVDVHKDFDASYSALLRWARRERLLTGQRNRAIEGSLVRLRNFVAHPERYHLTTPADAALPLRDAIEIVNRLWGSSTEGGRLFPAPLRREPIVIARNSAETEQTSLTRHSYPTSLQLTVTGPRSFSSRFRATSYGIFATGSSQRRTPSAPFGAQAR